MPAASPHGSRLAVLSITLVVVLGLTLASSGPFGSSSADETTTTATTTTTSVTTTSVPPTTTTTVVGSPFPWPGGVSSAIAVPEVSVAAASPHQGPRPIASLTKLMSTWVILSRLPLAPGQTGPCVTVNAHDVAVYNYDVATGQSSAKVAAGERLCENTLLTGMLVHSAGNFVYIFLRILKTTTHEFVAEMNAEAKAIGLKHTRYVDPTGIDPGDRSTAFDQAMLAADLMTSQAIVRSIVWRPRIVLPVAGALISYNPLVGTNGVVGVKSGYTIPAGGCDALALRVTINGLTYTTYAVVLGQQGGNSINRAGEEALELLHFLQRYLTVHPSSSGKRLVWTGSSGDVVTTTTTTTTTTVPSTSSTTVPTTTTTLP